MNDGLYFATEILCICGNYFLKFKKKENLQQGKNDDQVGKLLGQKMVDEIGSLFPCLQIFVVKNFVIRRLAMPISRVHHVQKCSIMWHIGT
jgi:hypothetical protein